MKFFKEIQLIASYLKPHKKKVYFLSVVVLGNSLINAFIPYIYGNLVDKAIAGAALLVLGGGLLLWLVLSIISTSLSQIEIKNADILAVRVNSSFLRQFASHFMALPLSYHRNQKVWKVIGRAERAGSGLERIVDEVVFSTLPGFVTVLIALIISVFINWVLALVLFVILVMYGLVTIWKTHPIIEENKKLHKIYDEAFSDYWEILENVDVVKSFTAEKSSERKLKSRFGNIVLGRLSNVLAWTALTLWQRTIFSIGFVGLFGLGLVFLKQDIISAGNLVTFVGYIALVYQPFGQLANNYRMIRRNMAVLEKSLRIYQVKTENQERSDKLIELEKVNGEIEFRNIDFFYPGKNQPQVLFDMNFKVKPGQVVE